MVASITANPNPVVFPWPSFLGAAGNTGTTRITWDGDGVRARVFQFANGQETLFDGNPQNGDPNGRKNADIKLGEVLEFRLRRANAAGTLLASVTVTTVESPIVPLPANPHGLVALAVPKQGIYRLSVSPGVDSLTMSFRTRQPTNPFVEVFNLETGEIAGLWARPDIQTLHRMDFEGWKRPFAQKTEHSYRIVAYPMPGGGPDKDEVTGTFRTGTRTVTFHFDKIHVRLDGDPNSPGEFSFSFGAGDAVTREALGNVEFYGETSITDGHTEEVKRVVTVPTAPRLLWAQVVAKENDSYPNPWHSALVGMRPTFAEPRAWIKETEQYIISHVADHFDVSELLEGVSKTPFVMSTPDWAIAYKVEGRLKVEASRGQWLTHSDPAGRALGKYQPFQLSAESKTLSVAAGQGGMMTAKDGRVHSVVQGPDGAVYHSAAGETAGASGKWFKVRGSVAGPVTAVATERGLGVAGLSPEGTVLYAREGEQDWRVLGGRFVGPVTAVAGEEGDVELFATDGDGAVFSRTIGERLEEDHPEHDWQRFGQNATGAISALFSQRSGISLFALGRGGEVLQKRRAPNGDWLPAEDWERVGVAADGVLGAEWYGDEAVLLSVVAADETVRILAWDRYPDAAPPREWLTIGTVNSLLQGTIPEEHT